MVGFLDGELLPSAILRAYLTLHTVCHVCPRNDGCGQESTDEYEVNMVHLIQDIREEFNNPKMAISIPVSGFDGWLQTNPRRLGIIQAQFNAANASLHPELGGHVIAEETRDFWRCGQQGQNCPSNQRFHFGHNAETCECMPNIELHARFKRAFDCAGDVGPICGRLVDRQNNGQWNVEDDEARMK